MLGHPGVEFVGEIGEAQKAEFLGGAEALLFPIAWPEPFGMVMIKAASCGTPVIAFGCGSVPEVIEPGVSGFIVSNEAEAVAAVDKLPSLSRAAVRSAFERRFTSCRMAANYAELYARLAGVAQGRFVTSAMFDPERISRSALGLARSVARSAGRPATLSNTRGNSV